MKKIGIVLGLLLVLLLALSFVSFTPEPTEAQYYRIRNFVPELRQDPVKIFMAGDIMLGRYVETLMKKEGDDYPFQSIKEVYKDSDLVFGNLEGPILTNHRQTPDNVMVFSFKPDTATILKRNGFNLVTLANNHTFDKGQGGLDDMHKYLEEAGIEFFGHPKDVSDVLEKEINGIEMVFIGLHDTFLNKLDHDAAVELVRTYKEQKKFVFVSVHWGSEYKLISNNTQKDFAHRLIDYGADIVVGHHPHVVQEIEEYNGSLIFYSLGNFIFDQYFSQETQQGLAVNMEVERSTIKFNLLPFDIKRSQPILMSESEEFLSELANRSSEKLKQQILDKYIELPRKTRVDPFPL